MKSSKVFYASFYFLKANQTRKDIEKTFNFPLPSKDTFHLLVEAAASELAEVKACIIRKDRSMDLIE